MRKYEVITLDVWGHGWRACEQWGCNGKCDGYTVNEAYRTGRFIEVANTKTMTIVRALVDAGELTERALIPGRIDVDGDADFTLYVNDSDDGQPLLQLECVESSDAA